MKYLQRLCAGVVLILAFALPAFAGQIPCGVTDEPPLALCSEASEATIETQDVTVDAMAMLLGGLLSIF